MKMNADWINVSYEDGFDGGGGYVIDVDRNINKYTENANFHVYLRIHICEDNAYKLIGKFYDELNELDMTIDWDDRLKLQDKVYAEVDYMNMVQATVDDYYD